MSFAQENGYTPQTFDQLMDGLRQGVNTQFSASYTTDTFTGTDLYKYFYSLVQKVQGNEALTAAVFQKLQEYIAITNEQIQRPSVSAPGLLDSFAAEGFVVSVRKPTALNAGKQAICVDLPESLTGVRASGTVEITDYADLVSGSADTITIGATVFTAQAGAATPGAATFQAATSDEATAESLAAQINAHATAGALVRAKAIGDTVTVRAILPGTAGNAIALVYTDNDSNVGAVVSGATLLSGTAAAAGYAAKKLEVATLIKDFVVAGLVSEGPQVQSITLSNGQSFDFKFYLPERTPILLKVTASPSLNSLITIPSDEDIREEVFAQANERYRLGWNFEPQRYFNLSDAAWAEELKLEYSLDGGDTWSDDVFDAAFDDLFTFGLEDIEVDIA